MKRAINQVKLGAGFACLLSLASAPIFANDQTSPKVNFNQTFIEQVALPEINLSQRDSVLSLVLKAMPKTITVYPSEGYYYFSFFSNGEQIQGNLRFDASLRDDGKISFVYFKAKAMGDKDDGYDWVLSSENGVQLTKTSDFNYQLHFKDITRTIKIYDAKDELANKPELAEHETYVGPVFDESGVRLSLIFDTAAKRFIYLHNSVKGYSETFQALDTDARILIGSRTGFAYYHDKENKRKILIGVSRQNVENNSYYDGPFDQLPDSFVSPEALQRLIEEQSPQLKGKIGGYGVFLDEEDSRYAISNYLEYQHKDELYRAYQCRPYQEKLKLNQCLSKDILE